MIQYFIQKDTIPYLDEKWASSSEFPHLILQLKQVCPKHPPGILS